MTDLTWIFSNVEHYSKSIGSVGFTSAHDVLSDWFMTSQWQRHGIVLNARARRGMALVLTMYNTITVLRRSHKSAVMSQRKRRESNMR